MDRHHPVAPRIATIEPTVTRREGRTPRHHRARTLAIGVGFALAGALAACSPGASSVPLPSINASALPSVNVSAAASLAASAGLAALDQVDAAITANTNANGLTVDEASSLTQLSGALRTAIQSGDTSGIKTALTNLSTKVDSFSAKLNSTPAGAQLTAAMAALKAALPAS